MARMVRFIRLNNRGAFTARLQFVFEDSQGRKIRTRGTGNILAGGSRTEDPGDYGVPVGATFHVYVEVVAGRDKVSCESFVYDPGCEVGAEFRISGTTLINRLTFVEYFERVSACADNPSAECILDEDTFILLRECEEAPPPGRKCPCCSK